MTKLINNRYFSMSFLPGLVFGIVFDHKEELLFIVLGFIDIEIKLWEFKRNKFGGFKK